MAEYIDRENAEVAIKEAYDMLLSSDKRKVYEGMNTALNVVHNIPAADVTPVVHCRECVHLGFKDWHGICEGGPMCGIVRPYDYCSHGVRKEGDNGQTT